MEGFMLQAQLKSQAESWQVAEGRLHSRAQEAEADAAAAAEHQRLAAEKLANIQSRLVRHGMTCLFHALSILVQSWDCCFWDSEDVQQCLGDAPFIVLLQKSSCILTPSLISHVVVNSHIIHEVCHTMSMPRKQDSTCLECALTCSMVHIWPSFNGICLKMESSLWMVTQQTTRQHLSTAASLDHDPS